MDSRHLSEEQLIDLGRIITRQLNFLARLQQRMERLRFSPTDDVFIATTNARNAMQSLNMSLHYLRCELLKKRR